MPSTLSQANKQPCKTRYLRAQRATGAKLHAPCLVSSTIHLLRHCSTMSKHGVCSPTGYMQGEYSRAIGKATKKRRKNDYFSPMKRAYFLTILLLSTHLSLFRRIDHVC